MNQFTKKNYQILLQFLILSAGMVLLMELLSRKSLGQLFAFMTNCTGAFLYNILIVYFTLCFSLLFRRRRFWLALISGLWLGICITNAVLMRYRSMPLTAPDILLMSAVRDIFEVYLSPLGLIGLMFLISALAATILYLWISVQKRGWIPVFAVVHIGILLLGLIGIDRLLIRKEYIQPKDEFYNLAQSYESNGFAYCFSASFLTGGVKEPEDYSQHEVRAILKEQNEKLPQTAEDGPNLIFVQLESFFDPLYLKNLTCSVDPIPNFRALKETCSHGFLSVPCVGAGTANTEFEVLTGMNLSHFGVGEYPYMSIVDSDGTFSLATALGKLQYDTHAIHNNNATFYNRHQVYENLSFRTFTSVEYMEEVTYNALGWAKDSCLTEEIMKCLSDNGERDLIYTVSVEPHGRYPKEPVQGAPVIPVVGMEDGERRNGFEYYLYALSQTDRFIGDLVARLSQFPEETVVVFFGDHLPSFNIQNEELSAGSNQTTEYVIWTNGSLSSTYKDLQTYQLGAYVMELAGIYEGPVFRYHQSRGYDSVDSDSFQEDLRVLEYDMIYGGGYALEGDGTILTGEPIQLGVFPVLIRDAWNDGNGFTVKGDNFTPCSVVYVDDVPCSTVFVSSEELKVENERLSRGSRICIAQVSAVDPLTVLSKSTALTM